MLVSVTYFDYNGSKRYSHSYFLFNSTFKKQRLRYHRFLIILYFAVTEL